MSSSSPSPPARTLPLSRSRVVVARPPLRRALSAFPRLHLLHDARGCPRAPAWSCELLRPPRFVNLREHHVERHSPHHRSAQKREQQNAHARYDARYDARHACPAVGARRPAKSAPACAGLQKLIKYCSTVVSPASLGLPDPGIEKRNPASFMVRPVPVRCGPWSHSLTTLSYQMKGTRERTSQHQVATQTRKFCHSATCPSMPQFSTSHVTADTHPACPCGLPVE